MRRTSGCLCDPAIRWTHDGADRGEERGDDAGGCAEVPSTEGYQGVGMSYKSDGKGNLAHSAVIVCYDGTSLTPKLVKRYDNIAGF